MGNVLMERAAIGNNNERNLWVGELYVKYERELFYYAKGFLYDAYKAEDVVHLTFVNILENIDRLDISDEIKVRGLLYTVLKNLCCNELVKNRKYKYEDLSVIENEQWVSEDGYEYVAFKEVLDEILKLHASYAEILTYRGFCGMKIEEISKVLGISPQTARQRLSRARRALKKRLDGKR